ncbi:MAG: hypothetical protein ABJC09_15660 [Terriglobia bacterium]
MNLTISLPDDLQAKLQAAAEADGKSVADVYTEAAERYIAHRDLDELGKRGRSYARSLGRRRADVLPLIDDTRRGR